MLVVLLSLVHDTCHMAYTIVGLGNPGEEYRGTRHNVGRMAVEYLAARHGVSEWRFDKKLNALRAKCEFEGDALEFVLPETYMNRSGGAVAPLIKTIKGAERLVVVYDDMDLPLGTFRVAFNRSSGGHRGVESIIKSIKTKAFVRFRIGVAPTTPTGKIKKPKGEDKVIDFLMGKLKPAEEEVLKKIYSAAEGALATLVTETREKAMSTGNLVL